MKNIHYILASGGCRRVSGVLRKKYYMKLNSLNESDNIGDLPSEDHFGPKTLSCSELIAVLRKCDGDMPVFVMQYHYGGVNGTVFSAVAGAGDGLLNGTPAFVVGASYEELNNGEFEDHPGY